ncbi:hypothetical protein Lalb_Chr07g0194381 [Lupinus albus]|uniref:Uncharacterized protein n=1 Tax=Lupinus albus TaxID=3870 RepID=A0A6A4QB03_LUPAL|nr:hypothetical protein Lalb_Chr07g0194381 [Lupinus albus]
MFYTFASFPLSTKGFHLDEICFSMFYSSEINPPFGLYFEVIWTVRSNNRVIPV